MRLRRLVTVALAAATLIGAAPALAGNRGTARVAGKTLQVEQFGPKHLLDSRSPRIRSDTRATSTAPVSGKSLQMEQLGPKHLLSRSSLQRQAIHPKTSNGFDWPLAAAGSGGLLLLLIAARLAIFAWRRTKAEPESPPVLNV